MSEWQDSQVLAGSKQDQTRTWVYGLLKPIEANYIRWKRDGETESTEISLEEFNALPRDDRGGVKGGGEKLTFTVDVQALNPSLKYEWSRAVFRGFPDWLSVVAPSINDVTGLKPPESVREFRRRASAGTWFVELEVITTTQKKDKSKTNQVPKFTRMTTNEEEVRGWIHERFRATKSEQVPDDIVTSGKILYQRAAKKDVAAFAGLLDKPGYENMLPFKQKLIELAQTTDWN